MIQRIQEYPLPQQASDLLRICCTITRFLIRFGIYLYDGGRNANLASGLEICNYYKYFYVGKGIRQGKAAPTLEINHLPLTPKGLPGGINVRFLIPSFHY
jgi:hypothetical protein